VTITRFIKNGFPTSNHGGTASLVNASNLVNLKCTGAGVIGDFPVGLLLQLSEVLLKRTGDVT
jgi:hypothetical protein